MKKNCEKFSKKFKGEIFAFTKKDDKGNLSFHNGELTIASIFKLYAVTKEFFIKKKKHATGL